MNTVFLFGAGAEYCKGIDQIKLPSGDSYTIKSLFNSDYSAMTSALNDFFDKRKIEYQRYSPFNAKSRLFKISIDRLVEDTGVDIKYKTEDGSTDYTKVYEELDSLGESLKDSGYSLSDIVFKGGIEQYFSSLADKANNKNRYWKIINYYWNCFFTILIPITDYMYVKQPEYTANKYEYILEHFEEVLSFTDLDFSKIKDDFQYYSLLSKYNKANEITVYTTNYTPLSEKLTKCDTRYLSGKLTMFENNAFEVNEMYGLVGSKVFFPYLLTQVPIKPIINSYQINLYKQFIDSLKKCDYCIIVGYSLCRNDQHILSLIHDCVVSNRSPTIIIYDYKKEAKPYDIKEVINENKKNILRLDDMYKDRIKVFEHDGEAKKIYDHMVSNGFLNI